MISKGIFITRFKNLCKLKKKTQAEIAETLGISTNGLKHYMRKTNNTFPPIEYLDLMAKEFDVDIAYLIGEIDVPKHNMLTISDTTGLNSKDKDMNMRAEMAKTYNNKDIEYQIEQYLDKTYALDLITRNSQDFSQDFCTMMDFLANSYKILELAHLIYNLLFNSVENSTVIIKTETPVLIDSCYTYAYRTEIVDKKILKNRIVYLFDEILTDEIDRYDSHGVDPNLAQNMIQQLFEFIEKNYFNIPRKKLIKIIDRRLEEIREIDFSSIILGYSPEKILEGFLIKLADLYNYQLSSEFLKKYEKEIVHPVSYYMDDFHFYSNRKKNYF